LYDYMTGIQYLNFIANIFGVRATCVFFRTSVGLILYFYSITAAGKRESPFSAGNAAAARIDD
ncbi:MAG: hypothetical protein U0M25_01230, partial [Oscillospiraceae bacterium]|nr:hypothetical protein [Oscillospiraceae bacterium]